MRTFADLAAFVENVDLEHQPAPVDFNQFALARHLHPQRRGCQMAHIHTRADRAKPCVEKRLHAFPRGLLEQRDHGRRCEHLQRAAAVKDLLVQEFDVPEDQLLTAGLGYKEDPFVRGTDWDANGNFVETEAAKNRRVIVIDAESEAAKKILE